MDTQALVGKAAVHDALCADSARLQEAQDTFAKVAALAGLAVLLPQHDHPTLPSELEEQIPLIVSFITSSDSPPSVQSTACSVIAGLMVASEGQWRKLTLDGPLVKTLAQLAATAASEDTGLRINALSALTSAAQGGDEGAQKVAEAGMGPILEACSASTSDHVQEAAADLCCQVASCEECRAALSEAGVVNLLARMLDTSSNEVRVRVLMALGMLLPSSSENQQALVKEKDAVRRLVELMSKSEDTDIKMISQNLVSGLAKSYKQEVAAALRSD